MKNQIVSHDLFGNPIRQRRPCYELALQRSDRASLAERAARLRWVRSTVPKNLFFCMQYETLALFYEVKATFISGYFVGTIVLATAFIEHWISSNLSTIGYRKEASQGLVACMACARKNDLIPLILLNKIEQLRIIRNPFIHLKPFKHEHKIIHRASKSRKRPIDLLESDAQESLRLAYAVALYSFNDN